MTGHKTTNLSDAIRNLIVCDTQFGWNGETILKLPELLDLQARGWLIEGDENNEFSLTVEGEAVIARALQQAGPAELAEQQGVDGYDKRVDLIARLYMARDMERAGAWSYLFAEAADALAATGKQQVGEVQGDAHVVVLREMRARLTDAGSPARTAALDAAISALAARQPGAQERPHVPPLPDAIRDVLEWYAEGPEFTAHHDDASHAKEKEALATGDFELTSHTDRGYRVYHPNGKPAERALLELDNWARLRDAEALESFSAYAQGVDDALAGKHGAAPPAQGVPLTIATRAMALLITKGEALNPVTVSLADAIANPPAQGVDLGQFREAVVAAREHHEQTWVDMHDTGHAKMQEYDRLLALIDQRDAAPGVGNGN